ncbi:probable serine/threonine-protein kinase roco5, partial [Saccostrea cucullata]|uniref:probable serine/threonine-protein kinase roco5 n=1 Tax=Saccostrea cuccullata TaxID=36930 RepID=UPI002ED34161
GIPVQVIMRGDDSVKNFLENLKRETTMHHATGMLIGCGVNSSSQNQRFKVRIDEKSQHHHVLESPVEKFDEVKALDINDIHDPGDLKEDTASEAAYDEDSSQDSIDTEPESLKGNEAAAPVPVTREKSVEGNTNIAKHSESLGVLRVVQNGSDEPEKKISMVDFAGQCSYYSSHQLFLSPRAFFILVFNMEKQFDEMVGEEVCSQKRSIYKEWTHRDYVSFWAKNIHQYSSEKAPILLVGTHAEKMTEEEKVEFFREIWKTLETKDKSLQGHLDKNRAFAIGFHENESIEKIKESIVDVVQKLDHWGEKLPRSWAMFENFFQEKKYLKIINIRTLMAFNEALPSDIKLGSVEDINIMLLYFHDIRDILYFNQNVLKEVIILDIQWFADAFKNVITDKNHAKEDLLEFSSEWDQFDDTGELSDTLLSRIWKMNDNEYIEHKDEIMLYMEKLGLLVKMDDKNWYVPCMNKKTYPGNSFSSNPSSSILCFTFDVLPGAFSIAL